MESTKIETMKKVAFVFLIPLLVACGPTKKEIAQEAPRPDQNAKVINIPESCLASKALLAVKEEITGATFIDTKWTPAPGTELADVLNNGGLACSYGLQSAEIGATIRWVEDSKGNFEKWSTQWLNQGYTEVDLTKFGALKGYFLMKPQSATQEFSIWNLNFKLGEVWVSISRTSGTTLDAGSGLIKAVLAQ